MTQFNPIEYKKIEQQVYSLTAASYEEKGSEAFERYAEPLIEAAGLKAGQSILDVACGPGTPSLIAAPRVMPGGTVTGIDLAPGMIAIARKKAQRRNIANAAFQEADAEEIPFPDGSFDVVICNHGLVHMTDRTLALREMHRVLKKGSGTLALSVWSTPDRALVVGIVAKTIRELWPAAVVPGAPMWFDFGAEGALEAVLSDCGFRDVRTTRYSMPLEIENGEAYWNMIVGVSGRLQMLLKNIPEGTAAQIRQAVIEAGERFRSPSGGISIPCEEVVGVGKA